MRLRLDALASPLGRLLIVCDEDGRVRALDFEDYEARMQALLRRHYGAFALDAGAAPLALKAALDAYFAGHLNALDGVETITGGTEFQRQVWRGLREIPPGATESYGALAVRLGRAGASRAVGLANGGNPVAIIVPCHRVIGANGALTGYAGGMTRKTWLLDHERRFAQAA